MTGCCFPQFFILITMALFLKQKKKVEQIQILVHEHEISVVYISQNIDNGSTMDYSAIGKVYGMINVENMSTSTSNLLETLCQ